MTAQRVTERLAVPAPSALDARRTAAVSAAVLAGCFVLGLTLQGVHARVGTPPRGHVVSGAAGYVVAATLGLGLVVGLALTAAFLLWRKEDAARRPQARLWERIVYLFIIVAIVCAPLAALAAFGGHRRNLRGRAAGHRGVTATNPRHSAAPVHVHWSSFVAAAIGALAGVALIAYFFRRDALQRAHRPLDRSSLAGAVAAGMAQLEAEPDPRLAVIRCYAAMEGSLGEEGVPRAAAETPLEYLRRLLSQLEVGGDAASRLTPLFERAKFSREEIDETMRREALEAVRALNEELAR